LKSVCRTASTSATSSLSRLSASPPSGLTSTQLATAAGRIAAGLESLMVAPAAGQLAFVQGTNDALRPLGAQTLGSVYLLARGRYTDALKVHDYVEAAFKVANRSVVTSSAPATFNAPYSATGPFSGYRAYASGRPDVLWHEGSAQADFSPAGPRQLRAGQGDRRLGEDHDEPQAGPLQADRTATGSAVNEYHVWPASAGTSWSLIAAKGLPG
jgi:hypothetical protein